MATLAGIVTIFGVPGTYRIAESRVVQPHQLSIKALTFRTAFLDWALEQFPDLAAEFDGESALMRLHIAFSRFYRATQQAIDEGDREHVKTSFQMADRVLANAYPEMRSLFHVIYVEHLKFDDGDKSRFWALDLLTTRLRNEFASSLGCSDELRTKLKL